MKEAWKERQKTMSQSQTITPVFDCAEEIRQEIQSTAAKLENLKIQLHKIESSCHHAWDKTKYDPIRHEGHQFAGDPPGTMGVDRQLSCYIPPSEEKRWTRKCVKCNMVQETRRTKREMINGSIPGTNAIADVPDFGDR